MRWRWAAWAGTASEAASATRGSAVVNHLFLEMRPHMGELGGDLSPGKLVATGASGVTTSYALNMVQERGELFVDVGEEVYGTYLLRAQNCAELRACSPNEMKSSPLTHFMNDEITVDAMSSPMKVAPRQSVQPIRLVGTISP